MLYFNWLCAKLLINKCNLTNIDLIYITCHILAGCSSDSTMSTLAIGKLRKLTIRN